jgi:nucleoside-diphosphate-sugar epimerase
VTRDFSDVRFVVETYCRLLESTVQGETVNVCSGQGVALREIIERMNQIAGYTIEVRVNADFVRFNEVRRLIGCNHMLQALIGELPNYPHDDILFNDYTSRNTETFQKIR